MIFSVHQLQEKCREEQMALYIAFIEISEMFDFFNRKYLFKLLMWNGCPQLLVSIITTYYEKIQGVLSYYGKTLIF